MIAGQIQGPDGLDALQRSRKDPHGVGKAADTKAKGDESALAAGPAFTPQSSVPTPAALTTAAGDSGSSAITGRGPRVPPQRMPNARRQSRITGSSPGFPLLTGIRGSAGISRGPTERSDHLYPRGSGGNFLKIPTHS